MPTLHKLGRFAVTAVGSSLAFVPATWGILEAYSYFGDDSLRQRLGRYWFLVYVVPVLVALAMAAVQFKRGEYPSPPDVVIQTGSVRLKHLTEPLIEVFYSQPFVSPPHLTLDFEAGSNNGRCQEQRPDGFSFLRGGATDSVGHTGVILHWRAAGVLAPRPPGVKPDA